MGTHPDTICQFARIDHQERLKTAARARLAGQAEAGRRPGGVLRALAGVAGAILVDAGLRLQGARRVGSAGDPAVPALGQAR